MQWPSAADHLTSPKPTKCFLFQQPRGCIVVLPGRTIACCATLCFPPIPITEFRLRNTIFLILHLSGGTEGTNPMVHAVSANLGTIPEHSVTDIFLVIPL